nr:MAG TPA: Topo homolgy domain in CRISPR-associated endonuclease Cas9 [Caudoviricetes sp.]
MHPLFNLQIPPESVSVKDTYPKGGINEKNVYVKWL